MPKPTKDKSKTPKAAAESAKLVGNKLTAKTSRAIAHKAPERRNENKVRGR